MRKKMKITDLPERIAKGEYGAYLQHPMSADERAKKTGEKLREYRLLADISQKELCSILDCAPQTYSTYESGMHEPRLETLARLSFLYDVPVDWLMGKKRFDDVDTEGIDDEDGYMAYLQGEDERRMTSGNKRLDALAKKSITERLARLEAMLFDK